KGSDGEMIVHEQLKSESHFARAMNTEEAPEYTTVSYKEDVLPILLDTCIGCHGDTDPESDFNLSTFDDFIAGGKKFGSPILTDNPANSPLIRYVTGELDPRMPKGEPALSTSQIAILTSWISDGAKPPEGYVKSAKAKKPQRKRTTSDDRLEFRYQHLTKASLEARDRIDPDAIGEEIFLDRKVGIHGIRRALRRAYIPTDEFSALIPESKNAIDWFIEREWKDKGIVDTANPCTDTDFVRRVYLDIIGVLPDASEARAFFDDPARDKRTALIDTLLAKSEEYADHWVPFWEDLLVSAPKQVDDERANNFDWHGYYRDWLYESFKKNKPLDQLVLELFDESLEDYQPRYMLTDSPDAVLQNVSAMSKVFMGISLRCTQCHNHFQNKQWTQSTIHGLGSFFTQDDLEIVRCLKPTGVKVAPKFIFPLPGEETVSNQSRRLDQVDFASHLVDPTHPLFSRTMVNRIWNRYLGRGISEPIDDFRFDILPNHMELWTWLSNDLARNEFDIKRLVRMILASDTYQRAYDGDLEDKPTRTNNTERHYLSPKLRRMSAEQFVDSARKILDLPYEGNDRSYRAMLVSPLEQSLGRQARSQVITKRSEEPSVVQALEFINGTSLNELVYESPFVQKESKRLLDPDRAAEVIEALYWGCHSRQPSAEEVAAALDYVQRLDAENLVDDRQILGDLYWAHLMSSDFLFIQ
ncbi:DUF1553 domain-containing protein, partial [bacterium AH-315-P07]|nr:DUF1553 domain-containing protein [bacterium AH-315-P07]